jgi:molybdate transport system permease protein
MVQPVRNAFQLIGDGPLEVAATLRAAPLDAFFSVAAPLARGGILSGAILSFAHTIGEFGVVLMIGGNIPGETRVLSVALFEHVEQMNYQAANRLALTMMAIAVATVLLSQWSGRRHDRF